MDIYDNIIGYAYFVKQKIELIIKTQVIQDALDNRFSEKDSIYYNDIMLIAKLLKEIKNRATYTNI